MMLWQSHLHLFPILYVQYEDTSRHSQEADLAVEGKKSVLGVALSRIVVSKIKVDTNLW